MNTKSFRTVSIIMIIFGILGMVGGVTMLSGTSWTLVSSIISIVTNLLLVVAGFMGTKAVKTGDDAKAALCKKLSLVLIVLAVVGIVVGFISNSQTSIPGINAGLVLGMAVIGSIISLILPVLYFFGAKKLD